MNLQLFLLAIGWVIYYILHSLLATISVKGWLKARWPNFFPYYRIFYSGLSFLLLVALLVFQLSIPSPMLFRLDWISFGLGIPLAMVGLGVMILCIRKYFFRLSGIAVFHPASKNEGGELEIEGLHRYMRHPLYAGTLVFAWSIFLLYPTWSFAIMCTLMTAYVLIGIWIEEKKLMLEFGENYAQYREQTPMLIPAFKRRKFQAEQSGI